MTSERMAFRAGKTSRVWPPGFGLSSKEGPRVPEERSAVEGLAPLGGAGTVCRQYIPALKRRLVELFGLLAQ